MNLFSSFFFSRQLSAVALVVALSTCFVSCTTPCEESLRPVTYEIHIELVDEDHQVIEDERADEVIETLEIEFCRFDGAHAYDCEFVEPARHECWGLHCGSACTADMPCINHNPTVASRDFTAQEGETRCTFDDVRVFVRSNACTDLEVVVDHLGYGPEQATDRSEYVFPEVMSTQFVCP